MPAKATKRAVAGRKGVATTLTTSSLFPRACAASGLPPPIAEYRFDAPRRWRFDWAWPECRVALEVEGGVWSGGRHTRGGGFLGDMEKYNRAAELGWRVFRTVPSRLLAAIPLLQRVGLTRGS